MRDIALEAADCLEIVWTTLANINCSLHSTTLEILQLDSQFLLEQSPGVYDQMRSGEETD